MTEKDLQQRFELATRIAKAAGEGTLRHYHRPDLQVEHKADGTPVTIADREAESYLREQIAAVFPQDAILGEELPDRPGNSGFQWILDPIDGTKAFIYGVPLYGTMVGVTFEKRSVIGAVALPALDECVYAAKGLGAWYARGNAAPVPARVSQVSTLSDALLIITEVGEYDKQKRRDAFEQLRMQCKWTRGWGDCFGYLLVATGRAEVMLDPGLSIWDMAALPPILEEAGGSFTDWQGQPTIYGRDGLSTNGHLLAEVLKITRGK